MKHTHIIALGAFVLLLLIGSVVFWLWPKDAPVEPVPVDPLAPAVDPTDIVPDVPYEIALADGSTIEVQNFIPQTQPEWWKEGLPYFIAGNGDVSGPGYEIQFSPETSKFIVTIFKEPIGERRKAAEQVLRTSLGLPDSALCWLKYGVYVLYEVNPTYGDRNLGFSFCPGSVPLPE